MDLTRREAMKTGIMALFGPTVAAEMATAVPPATLLDRVSSQLDAVIAKLGGLPEEMDALWLEMTKHDVAQYLEYTFQRIDEAEIVLIPPEEERAEGYIPGRGAVLNPERRSKDKMVEVFHQGRFFGFYRTDDREGIKAEAESNVYRVLADYVADCAREAEKQAVT